MLFNSVPFILFFLPLVWAVFFVIGRVSQRSAALWLALASLFFYGWWDPRYLFLLLLSIGGNFWVGNQIAAAVHRRTPAVARHFLVAGVVTNLSALGYYKYAGFFMENLAAATGWDLAIQGIVLPLGISFFTFTQIAFLVDCRQGKVREPDFVHYLLFVTYFPHLIAGPILHHAQMMPQFADRKIYRPSWKNLSIGLMFFSIGLFKKVVVADGVAPYVGPVFAAAEMGRALTWLEATSGALAYSLQLYFDFSGYCDMAIGVSRLFGVHLPLNFDSPYQARNIVDFWRRWHMTLSQFLRDYLYIPLGGNRLGAVRRYLNLLVTMLLGGLWHGAAWTYVVWGAGHGILLAVNHAWHWCCKAIGWRRDSAIERGLSVALTFTLVMMLWVFFRASTVSSAMEVLKGMLGFNGMLLPDTWSHKNLVGTLQSYGVRFVPVTDLVTTVPLNWFFWCGLVVFFAPNSQQIANWLERRLSETRQITAGAALLDVSVTLLVSFLGFLSFSKISKGSEFLYFQF